MNILYDVPTRDLKIAAHTVIRKLRGGRELMRKRIIITSLMMCCTSGKCKLYSLLCKTLCVQF